MGKNSDFKDPQTDTFYRTDNLTSINTQAEHKMAVLTPSPSMPIRIKQHLQGGFSREDDLIEQNCYLSVNLNYEMNKTVTFL